VPVVCRAAAFRAHVFLVVVVVVVDVMVMRSVVLMRHRRRGGRRRQHGVFVRLEVQFGRWLWRLFHVIVVVITVVVVFGHGRVAHVRGRGGRGTVWPVGRSGRCGRHGSRRAGRLFLRLGRRCHRRIRTDLAASPHQHGQRARLRV